jgi:hypothetical protein
MGAIGRAVKGFTDFKGFFDCVVDIVKEMVCYVINGKSREDLKMEERYPKLTVIEQHVAQFKTLDIVYNIKRSKEACEYVVGLYDTLSKYQQLALAHQDKKIVPRIKVMLVDLKEIYEEAKLGMCLRNKTRNGTVIVIMRGEAGCGKTQLMQHLVERCGKEFYSDVRYESLAYDRKAENEYWDGYRGQPVVKYDDAFQRVETPQNPNPEIMEMVRISNTDAYQLHMSAVPDKANTYFEGEFCFLTTNRGRNYEPVSIASVKAFQRRFDLDVTVSVKEDWSIESSYKNKVLDMHKVLKHQNPGKSDQEINDMVINRTGKPKFEPMVYSLYVHEQQYGKEITYKLDGPDAIDKLWELIVKKRRELLNKEFDKVKVVMILMCKN